MTTTSNKRLFGPGTLTASPVTKYTAPSGGSAQIRRMRASSTNGSARTVTISIGTDATGTRIYNSYPVSATLGADIFGPFNLAADEILQAFCDSSGLVVLEADGTETVP
jgi:hypothetical protein